MELSSRRVRPSHRYCGYGMNMDPFSKSLTVNVCWGMPQRWQLNVRHLTVLFRTEVSSFVFKVEKSGRTVQYKLNNAQSLRLFGLHSDVNDAHRAHANRLQNKHLHVTVPALSVYLSRLPRRWWYGSSCPCARLWIGVIGWRSVYCSGWLSSHWSRTWRRLFSRTHLPTYAALATHDSHSLKKDDDSILHTHHLCRTTREDPGCLTSCNIATTFSHQKPIKPPLKPLRSSPLSLSRVRFGVPCLGWRSEFSPREGYMAADTPLVHCVFRLFSRLQRAFIATSGLGRSTNTALMLVFAAPTAHAKPTSRSARRPTLSSSSRRWRSASLRVALVVDTPELSVWVPGEVQPRWPKHWGPLISPCAAYHRICFYNGRGPSSAWIEWWEKAARACWSHHFRVICVLKLICAPLSAETDLFCPSPVGKATGETHVLVIFVPANANRPEAQGPLLRKPQNTVRCRWTRRSTSGGCVMHGNHLLRQSLVQNAVKCASSSDEAELNAQVKRRYRRSWSSERGTESRCSSDTILPKMITDRGLLFSNWLKP